MKKHSLKFFAAGLAVTLPALSSFLLPLVLQSDIRRTENIVYGGEQAYYEVRTIDDFVYSEPKMLSQTEADVFADFVRDEIENRLNYKLPRVVSISAMLMDDGTLIASGAESSVNGMYYTVRIKNADLSSGTGEIETLSVERAKITASPFVETAVTAFYEVLGMTVPEGHTVYQSMSLNESGDFEVTLSWEDASETETRIRLSTEFSNNHPYEALPDDLYENRPYCEQYRALFTNADLSAGTGVLTELVNCGDTQKPAKAEPILTESLKESLLKASDKFIKQNSLRADSSEGIADKPIIGANTDIDGINILEIVYRNNDTTRTVVMINTDGQIRGYRAGIFYVGNSYLLTEETKALYFALAKTELKNRFNVSLPEDKGFTTARLDPTTMTLGISVNNLQAETPDGFSVSFNNLNLDRGTGSVNRASVHLTNDVSAIKETILPFEELSAGEFEKHFGYSMPSKYEVSSAYLSFYLNEVSISLTWTDSTHQSDISYFASMTSVDILNTTANFSGMGMEINYQNYTGGQKYTTAQIDKMTEIALAFTDSIKIRTSDITDTQNFKYFNYEGLSITFSPEPPYEMNTIVRVSKDGEILSYSSVPLSPRHVPLDISPR